MTSFCFDEYLSFSSRIVFFLNISAFIWEVQFTCFPQWSGITVSQSSSNTKFLKVLQFSLLIQICHEILLSLKPGNVNRIFWIIWIDLETLSDYHLLLRFIFNWGFWFSCKFFIFLGVFLSKIETKLLSKTAWVLITSILLKISNLNWSLSYCLKLQYINFLGSKFSNFILRILYMMVIN